MPIARDLGADRVELYTEPYAAAMALSGTAGEAALTTYGKAALAARAVGLGVNAGHDLSDENLAAFVKRVAPDEVSIGHALIALALELGLGETVRRYQSLCRS
jgi:pyridoxine 5-phosphate synthase